MDDSKTGRGDPSVDRLARVTAAYGADPARWPAEEREALRGLLKGMDAAADRIDEEQALDRLLDMVPPPEPPPGAVDRILGAAGIEASGARVLPFPKTSSAPRIGFGLRPAVGVIAASLLLGIITGNFDYADPLIFGVQGDSSAEIDDLDPAFIDLGADTDSDEDEDPL